VLKELIEFYEKKNGMRATVKESPKPSIPQNPVVLPSTKPDEAPKKVDVEVLVKINETELHERQTKALTYVRETSLEQHQQRLSSLLEKVKKFGFSEEDLNTALRYIEHRAPIIIHLKLDQILPLLSKDTHYRNQFETGRTNGSNDLVARSGWEDKCFNNAYKESTPFHRPKYGVLNVVSDPRGITLCSSYGDSYLVLRKHMRSRVTGASCDTSNSHVKVGTLDLYGHVLEAFSDNEIKVVLEAATKKSTAADSSKLATYKELQVHGEVLLERDIESIVVNTRHKSDKILVELVESFCAKYSIKYFWLDQYKAPDVL